MCGAASDVRFGPKADIAATDQVEQPKSKTPDPRTLAFRQAQARQ
jgi:hypothetical protein